MIQSINYKGISHHPDNTSAPDGDLSLCMNLVNDDGNIRPLEKPTFIVSLPENYVALYLHESPQALYKNLIVYNQADKSLLFARWEDVTNKENNKNITWNTIMTELTELPSVTAIGNTLVISAPDKAVKYAVWKNETIFANRGSYTPLSQHPPFIPIQFGLFSYERSTPFETEEFSFKLTSHHGDSGNVSDNTLGSFDNIPEDISREHLEDSVLSVVNKFIKDNTTDTSDKEGRFIFPFLVRYALRFYDGTLTQHSCPVLMIPNSSVLAKINNMQWSTGSGLTMTVDTITGRIYAQVANLIQRITSVPEELNQWKDLIQGIDIFISAPIYTYDQSGYIKGWSSLSSSPFVTHQKSLSVGNEFLGGSVIAQEKFTSYNHQLILPEKNKKIVKDEIESCSLFYKIASIPFSEIKEYDSSSNLRGFTNTTIKSSTLSALTSQEVMTDDFNSHHNIIANNTFVYNNRLNLADIKEEIIADIPIDSQFAYLDNPQKTVTRLGISLTINSQLQTIHNAIVGHYNSLPRYLYFPHPNATNIRWLGNDEDYPNDAAYIFDFPLKPHHGLNGAVYFQGFDEDDMPNNAYSFYDYYDKAVAIYPNKIYSSEVDNPFVFKPANINTLNCGVIKSISSVTQALSQGQFGQFPLYAFTDNGIWALSISNTGSIASIQPVCRDVILDGTEPLNIDNAVVFMSAKGMMILQGSNTTLLSSNLSNKGDLTIPDLATINITDVFDKFPTAGTLAYDYSHQRIYLFTKNIAWVYSLKTKLWSQSSASSGGTYALNSYPDTILVEIENDSKTGLKQSLASLNAECKHYDNGFLLTRPIKFMSTSLRTIRDIITYGLFSPDMIRTVLYGSPDMRNFVPIASSQHNEIHHISGSPYKAHRLLLQFINVEQDTTVSHTSFDVNERYTNKLR